MQLSSMGKISPGHFQHKIQLMHVQHIVKIMNQLRESPFLI
jgi:hypothetical protein